MSGESREPPSSGWGRVAEHSAKVLPKEVDSTSEWRGGSCPSSGLRAVSAPCRGTAHPRVSPVHRGSRRHGGSLSLAQCHGRRQQGHQRLPVSRDGGRQADQYRVEVREGLEVACGDGGRPRLTEPVVI